jgi:hypothetical protein
MLYEKRIKPMKKQILPLIVMLSIMNASAQQINQLARVPLSGWNSYYSRNTRIDSDNAIVTPVNKFLNELNGRFRPMVCHYSGSSIDSVSVFSQRTLAIGEAKWNCGTKVTNTTESNGKVLDLALTFKLVKGVSHSSGIAAVFDFTDWNIENYILVPAMLYGGNRFRILPLGYPPYIHNESDRPLDMPVTTTNILHLNADGSPAKVEMNTGNVATPMLSFFNPQKKQGFILLTEQTTRFGNSGLFVEEDAGPNSEHKRMSFIISAPGVREQRYSGSGGRAASGDQGEEWKSGDQVTLNFKIYQFRAAGMTAFYEKVFDVRKALSGANKYPCVTPYSAAADLILEHHNAHKWFENEKTAHYSNNPGGQSPYHFQIGWGSMPILAFPNLISGTSERLRRYCATLDNMVFKAQGKTGLFYAINRDGEFLGDTYDKMAERRTIAMTRRSMDVLYFSLRSLELMKQRGQKDLIKPEWEISLQKCADGLVKVWNKYGQFGQFIDVDSGKMDINGSTAGCAAGAPLTLAGLYFHEPKYIEVAEASMRVYYERDFLKGYAGGGAAEILQSPDSEAPWDMIESCMALYDATGKKEWLERAKFAANMLATWMVSYDYRFPKGSSMEKAGTCAAGSIFASSQNNHSAPGYYILSGDCLLKLFRASGDKRYAEMYKDQSHNVVQYVGTPYNPLRKESGFVTERVQLSDWEGKESVGGVYREDSNMAWEALVALTCLENPGIYLHTNDDTFIVLDHVEARVLRNESGVLLQVTNPTKYDANVSVLAETAQQSKKPLPMNAFTKWPNVEIKAGQTVTVRVTKNGQIENQNTSPSLY